MIFDNAKIRAWCPTTWRRPVRAGAREIVAWHDEDPARRAVDERDDALMDQLAARYGRGA